jgi:hypothetical protein
MDTVTDTKPDTIRITFEVEHDRTNGTWYYAYYNGRFVGDDSTREGALEMAKVTLACDYRIYVN